MNSTKAMSRLQFHSKDYVYIHNVIMARIWKFEFRNRSKSGSREKFNISPNAPIFLSLYEQTEEQRRRSTFANDEAYLVIF